MYYEYCIMNFSMNYVVGATFTFDSKQLNDPIPYQDLTEALRRHQERI